MFPKMGKTFPDDYERKVDRLKYQMAIAAALKRELGGSPSTARSCKRLVSKVDIRRGTGAIGWYMMDHATAPPAAPSGQDLSLESAREWREMRAEVRDRYGPILTDELEKAERAGFGREANLYP